MRAAWGQHIRCCGRALPGAIDALRGQSAGPGLVFKGERMQIATRSTARPTARQAVRRRSTLAAGLGIAVLATGLTGGLAAASETVTYTYDAQGRLVTVEHTDGPNDGVKREYEYDDADNRTGKKTTGA